MLTKMKEIGLKNLNIYITLDGDNAAVSLKPLSSGEDQALDLRPIVMSGTISDVEENLVAAIGALKSAAELFINIEAYEDQVTEAKKNTVKEKEKGAEIKNLVSEITKLTAENNVEKNRKKLTEKVNRLKIIDLDNVLIGRTNKLLTQNQLF